MNTGDAAGISVRYDLKPGDVGSIVYLHGTLYAREYGFDSSFEPYVAAPLAEFALSRNDRSKIWIVEQQGGVRGSMAIVECSADSAQLRWLILHPDVRGLGLGKRLVEEGVGFCREKGYSSIFLWTVGHLDAATHIYQSEGFELKEEKSHRIWGVNLTEQKYVLNL
jgi:GNAT superfamily N-acetyltransferase